MLNSRSSHLHMPTAPYIITAWVLSAPVHLLSWRLSLAHPSEVDVCSTAAHRGRCTSLIIVLLIVSITSTPSPAVGAYCFGRVTGTMIGMTQKQQSGSSDAMSTLSFFLLLLVLLVSFTAAPVSGRPRVVRCGSCVLLDQQQGDGVLQSHAGLEQHLRCHDALLGESSATVTGRPVHLALLHRQRDGGEHTVRTRHDGWCRL